MYNQYFGFAEAPFSIAPDPRYLFLSEQHREALAHLLYGIGDQGGFIVLTGEVGTGKTTVCRCLLQQLPEHADVAFIVNPKLDSRELLQTICEELGAPLPDGNLSIKQLVDALNELLLSTHARGRNAILIIDEAQNLDVDVLEQLRLLTNLETAEKKLLQLILLGQPELNTLLARPDLRQLAQRITARYHLRPLSREEVALYIEHRLAIAGYRGPLFTPPAEQCIYRFSQGVPRLINLLCDRALLGVYANNGNVVDVPMVRRAAREVLPASHVPMWMNPRNLIQAAAIGGGAIVLAAVVALALHRPQTIASLETHAPAAIAQTGWLHALSTNGSSESTALAVIYQRWGRNLNDAQQRALMCTGVDGADWSCLHLDGQTFEDLKRYDRPLLLFIATENGNAALALLEIHGEDALVFFAGREWTIPWRELASRWQGVIGLPLLAPVGQLPLQSGANDALIGWVDEQLYRHYHQEHPRWIVDNIDDSAHLGDAAPKAAWLSSFYLGLHPAPRKNLLDVALSDELKRFQSERKLPANGVIDLPTVLALSQSPQNAAPRLLNALRPSTKPGAVAPEQSAVAAPIATRTAQEQ